MNLMVTGANGQLGSELMLKARAAGHLVSGTTREDCNLTDQDSVDAAFDQLQPDVVINCAAWTRVDAAEEFADAAYRVNALGPRLLAGACRKRGALMVHISTDYIFGGAQIPIDEWHQADPRSVYGASKLAGEWEVRTLAPNHLIVRTSWLYGRDGPNFVLTMLRMAATQQIVRVVEDQLGSPTWTGHLAPAILSLVDRRAVGIFHLTNESATSWHGFAQAIFADADVSVDLRPISTAEYPTPAARPAYSVLDNRAWRLLGEPSLPNWREGLRTYITELRQRRILSL